MSRRNKEEERAIARRRIATLFEQAQMSGDEALSRRYVVMARRISTKYRVRIPPQFRRRYCRSCNAFWVPSKTVRVRITGSKVVYSCLSCGAKARLQLRR